MDDDSDQDNPIEDDYYTLLNVPRNASQEEITNAYRRQSKLYHPDKHPDPELKKEAVVLFNRTKKAYEVLSDPHLRAIYDCVGVHGLETDGWAVVQRTKTPQEIREEYEYLAKQREERNLLRNANPRGNIIVNINATDLFNKYEEEYDNRGLFSYIEVSGMSFSQSVEVPLTSKNIVTLYGELGTRNGVGSGNINISARRLLGAKGWGAIDIGAGNGPTMSFKLFRQLTSKMFCHGTTMFHFTDDRAVTGFLGTMGMYLDNHMIGYVSFRAGQYGGMNTMIVRQSSNSNASFKIHFGIIDSYIGLGYTYKMEELTLTGNLKAGTLGVTVEYGASKKISDHSTVSALVRVGVPSGVVLKFKLSRANQVYTFPIHVCEEALPAPIFYATVVPLIGWAFVKRFVIKPIVTEREEREKERQKEVNKTRMMEKQKEAKAAIELMRATVSRIRAEEESKRGLIITKALYGRFVYPQQDPSVTQDSLHRDDVIDVTIPLQCLVRDSQLVLHNSSKSQLPGFYDPCVGEDKQLLVQYLFHTKTHECLIQDGAPLRIPVASHKVNTT